MTLLCSTLLSFIPFRSILRCRGCYKYASSAVWSSRLHAHTRWLPARGSDTDVNGGAQFYVLRKLIERELMRKGYNHRHAYIASLSSQTIVYKGQLMPSQARRHTLHPTLTLQAGVEQRRARVRARPDADGSKMRCEALQTCVFGSAALHGR